MFPGNRTQLAAVEVAIPREMEHTSAPMIEQTAKTTGEEALAGDALALKTSTSSVPEKAADATPVDAGLLEHVSVL